MAYRASIIKSVQYGTVALGDTVASNTATITAVVVANSVVQWVGTSTASTTPQSSQALLVITNTTTITATRLATAGAQTVGFVVIEYVPGIVRSNQDFTVTMNAPATSNTATITSVNVNKTVIVFRGWDVDSGSSIPQGESYATLTNATTVTATRTTGTNNAKFYGTALEFR